MSDPTRRLSASTAAALADHDDARYLDALAAATDRLDSLTEGPDWRRAVLRDDEPDGPPRDATAHTAEAVHAVEGILWALANAQLPELVRKAHTADVAALRAAHAAELEATRDVADEAIRTGRDVVDRAEGIYRGILVNAPHPYGPAGMLVPSKDLGQAAVEYVRALEAACVSIRGSVKAAFISADAFAEREATKSKDVLDGS